MAGERQRHIWWFESERRWWMERRDPLLNLRVLSARTDAIWITNAYQTLPRSWIKRLARDAIADESAAKVG